MLSDTLSVLLYSLVCLFTFEKPVVQINALHNKYCHLNCEFNNNNFLHTVCERENVECGQDVQCGNDFKTVEFEDNMRQFILDLHNQMRNRVALGKEIRGKQPPASNMNILTYSRELEFIAQCWANTCNGNPLNHDICRRTAQFEYVGQNLGFYNRSDSHIDIQNTIKDLITYWYDEVAIFKREWVNFTDDRGPKFKVGHYTQLLWSDTSYVGCAATYYTTEAKFTKKIDKWHHIVFVCNYAPGGNYITLPVYKVGKPCSRCPSGSDRNDYYFGLCGNSKLMNGTDINFEPIFSYK